MIRVGLAGYGMAGREIHGPLLRQAGFEVVAVATSSPARVSWARADLPGVSVVRDLEELLREGGLDLVVLATPTGSHAAHTAAVLEAGIPVVVDKPLAVDAAQALALVEHAERLGVPLTVFQNRRYDPEQTTLTEVVRSGAVGRPFRLEMRWERWRPVPRDRWRETAPASDGGGILLDLHTHLVDIAVQLFGPVESVFATVASRHSLAEDDAVLIGRHAGGVVSHLGATSLSGAPGPWIRLLGEEGAFVVSALHDQPTIYDDLADAGADHCGWLYRGREREPVRRMSSGEAEFYRQLALALGRPDRRAAMPVDPRDSVHVLAVIDAARLSAAQDRVVLL